MKIAELKARLAQASPGSPGHRALQTAIAQAEAKLAADEAARAEAKESETVAEKVPQKSGDQAKANPFYQAIGTIRGQVSRTEQGQLQLTAYGMEDWLVSADGRTYKALMLAFDAGDPRLDGALSLKCYPMVGRKPGGNYVITGFRLVGFDAKAVEAERDGLFTLAGIWQWLPMLKSEGVTLPVLTVYRNTVPRQTSSGKPPLLATHCPLIWEGRQPWSRELGQPPGWVKVQAKLLLPERVFEFVELLEECERAPKRVRVTRRRSVREGGGVLVRR